MDLLIMFCALGITGSLIGGVIYTIDKMFPELFLEIGEKIL